MQQLAAVRQQSRDSQLKASDAERTQHEAELRLQAYVKDMHEEDRLVEQLVLEQRHLEKQRVSNLRARVGGSSKPSSRAASPDLRGPSRRGGRSSATSASAAGVLPQPARSSWADVAHSPLTRSMRRLFENGDSRFTKAALKALIQRLSIFSDKDAEAVFQACQKAVFTAAGASGARCLTRRTSRCTAVAEGRGDASCRATIIPLCDAKPRERACPFASEDDVSRFVLTKCLFALPLFRFFFCDVRMLFSVLYLIFLFARA